MTVSFNPQISAFNQMRNHSVANKPNFTSATDVAAAPKQEVVAEEPKKKTSLWQKTKNFITGIKKGFITAGEYIVGTVKGVFYGAIGAAGVLGVDAVRNAVKKTAGFSTAGKIIAGVVGLATLGYQLFNANLNANQRKAEVEHRWATGHNE